MEKKIVKRQHPYQEQENQLFGRDINFLIQNGIIEEIAEKLEPEDIRKRKREVDKLYVEYGEVSIGQLARRFGVSESTIKRDIADLVAKGIIKREQDARIANRRTEVARLFGTMNERDIAKELNVSKGTIDADIRFLKRQGTIEESRVVVLSKEKQKQIKERRERFESIYNNSKEKLTVKQVADLLGIPYTIAYRDFRILKREGRLKNFDEENAQEEEQVENKRSPKLEKRIKIIYQKIMSLYKEGKIKKSKELLRLLGERINFNEQERKTYDEIMAIFDRRLEDDRQELENEEKPIKSGDER